MRRILIVCVLAGAMFSTGFDIFVTILDFGATSTCVRGGLTTCLDNCDITYDRSVEKCERDLQDDGIGHVCAGLYRKKQLDCHATCRRNNPWSPRECRGIQ